ncbi:hypothetical protein CFC21_026130 [Triticum aestivum]|uniref:Uncharacterized protein n=2 Tax=Triticum aestivum TaxID=4565 RepID=A0A3B6CHN4_WHEAT|nr:uncharacterized protein LOC119366162 [Triticum dicoccoides]XP_044326625.1 uncharacterized protein LOC123047198 [Triticum aestivum]KAF7011866.1 hypothetical protein CFC21_026130 [Triticum aestivum]
MGPHPATVPCSLRCGAAAAAVRRSGWARSAGFLVRDGGRSNGTGVKLSCVGPTAWSYPHNFDSDSEPMPPGRWWGEALLEEDAEFFPLADFIPVGQGRKELDAIWHALVAGPLESVQLTLREILAAGNLFRCRSFHLGTLSGALLVVAGVFQLCKTSPTLFVDIVLGSVFYKLSVLSGQLQREGKSFSICARIQLVLLLILSFKDNGASQGFYRFLVESIWLLNIYVYLIMAYDATVGVKHGRLEWLGVYRMLRTKGGLMKVLKHTFLDILGGNKKPVSIKRRHRKGQ